MSTGDHTGERERKAATRPPSWITGGSLARAAWRLALPMMGGAVLQDLFTIVDTIFVGRLGPAAIAAVTISGTILGMAFMLAMGITTGCMVLVAQAVGAGNRPRAEKVAAQALLISLVLSVIVAAVGLPLARGFLQMLGAEEDVVTAATPYLQISAGCSFAMFLTVTFAAAMRGAGDAVTPLKVIGLCNLVNIVLDPILIFGWFGLPRLGVAGSATATVISRLLAAILLGASFFIYGHQHFHLSIRDLKPDPKAVFQIFKIGVFSSAQMLIRNISALLLVRLVAAFGTVALAAYGIGMRLRMLVMMPGMGFGMAAATLVGQNLGAGKPGRASKAAWLATAMYAAIALIMTAVFCTFAEPLVRVFNSQHEVVVVGAAFLRWFSATFAFMALSIVLGRAMNGAGDTFWPMVITAISMLGLRIPVAYGLAHFLGSVTGIWAGLAMSNVIQGWLFAAAFQWGRWKIIGHSHLQAAGLPARSRSLTDDAVSLAGGND